MSDILRLQRAKLKNNNKILKNIQKTIASKEIENKKHEKENKEKEEQKDCIVCI